MFWTLSKRRKSRTDHAFKVADEAGSLPTKKRALRNYSNFTEQLKNL